MKGQYRFDGSLEKVVSISISCDDCGHERRMYRDALNDLRGRGLQTVSDLYQVMYCRHCRAKGGEGISFTIRPLWSHRPVSFDRREQSYGR